MGSNPSSFYQEATVRVIRKKPKRLREDKDEASRMSVRREDVPGSRRSRLPSIPGRSKGEGQKKLLTDVGQQDGIISYNNDEKSQQNGKTMGTNSNSQDSKQNSSQHMTPENTVVDDSPRPGQGAVVHVTSSERGSSRLQPLNTGHTMFTFSQDLLNTERRRSLLPPIGK